MTRIRIANLTLVATVALAACGGGGRSSAVPALLANGNPNGVTPSYVTKGFTYDTKTLQKAHFLGPASFNGFGFDVSLKLNGLSGLVQYASQVSDPKSGNYRHFLTPHEIGTRYGASQATVAAAIKYLQSYGLAVTTWPQNMMLHVAGPRAALEAAFNTTFGTYRLGNDTIVGPITPPSVPASLGLAGSPNIVAWPSRYIEPLAQPDSATTNNQILGYSPQQVANGFDYTGAYAAGYNGSGISIGIIGTGPVAISGLDGITLGDVDATEALFGVSRAHQIVLAPVGNAAGGNAYSAGGFATPLAVNNGSGCGANGTNPSDGISGSISPTASCNPEDVEAQIDTEQTALLAPGANIEFYLAYNPNDYCNGSTSPGDGNNVAPATCPPGSGLSAQGLLEPDAEIQQAIADNTADVLSLSYGTTEYDVEGTPNVTGSLTYEQFEVAEFAALASEGIAVFVSSGDTGAEGCQGDGPAASANSVCVNYPASDPNAVSVGGATIPLNGEGQLIGPISAWGVQTFGGVAGSGGGLSILFNTPSFQSGVDYYTPSGEQPLSMRGVPDVSLLGDPSTGVATVTNADPTLGGHASTTTIFGGTSVAAPQMAAMWSLVLQACAQSAACVSKGTGPHAYRLGDPNPLFYALYGNGSGAHYSSTFYNVVYGSNALLCGGGQNFSSPCPTGTNPPTLAPGYSAGSGYNLVTGIGTPFGRALIKAIVGV